VNRITHYYGRAHLGHECGRHSQHDRCGAIARGEDASGVKQLVADDLGDKDCSESSEEDQGQVLF
jgi:hypothetical protein